MLYGDQPRLSGTPSTEYRDDTIILERFFARSMPRGHGTLERQSTQNALSIQLWAFYTTSHTSKKQRHFVLCSNSLLKFNSHL